MIHEIVKGLILFVAYVLTARFGLGLSTVSGFAALVWVPTGISFAALYLWGRRMILAIFLGASLVNYLNGADFFTALIIGCGNTLEAWVGVTLFRKFAGEKSRLESVRDVAAFVGFGALLSTVVSATVGVGVLHFSGVVKEGALVETWRAWWVGDVLSDLVIAPIFLVWSRPPERGTSMPRRIEGAVLIFLVIGMVSVLFAGVLAEDLHYFIRPHWIFLFLIWGVLRFSPHFNVLMTFLLSAIAIFGTMMGKGPYQEGPLSDNLLLLQLFSSAVALAGLFFGALGKEKENALRIRTDFISIASHELRTPLTSLSISLEVLRGLQRESKEAARYEQVMETLDRQTKKLTALVDSLLDVAQLESGNLVLEKKETDLSELVSEVSRNLGDLLGRAFCKVELNIQPKVKGNCSADGIEQILTNLLMNSMKYGAGKTVRICLSEKNNVARLTVKDEGVGIPVEHHRKIFERYHRVNKETDSKGLGLGLYISRLIVDAHHGKISVESEVGKGATFIVEIPFA